MWKFFYFFVFYSFVLQHVFVAFDEENVYTYVHYRDTVQGEILNCKACSEAQAANGGRVSVVCMDS